MTWHNDQIQGRASGQERDALLAERAALEQQIHQLKSATLSRSQAAAAGRQEDLLALARKMVNIDRRLGRICE